MLEVLGEPGSPDLVLQMSGSFTVTNHTALTGANSDASTMRLLGGDNRTLSSWATINQDWGGAPLWKEIGGFGDNIVTPDSTLRMTIVGEDANGPINVVINFAGVAYQATQGAADGVVLPFNPTAAGGPLYPAVQNGTVTMTVEGSASFTLTGGRTFDDLNLGSRTAGPSQFFGDNVIQTVSVIPEPSVYASVFGLVVIFMVLRRRR
ncbi:MAG: PEP-CTERM sorting domain-containing protein [Opitutales bacterium]|nr:PEP-CTERM sorting domain-containing protein [Opitutales bacterium]